MFILYSSGAKLSENGAEAQGFRVNNKTSDLVDQETEEGLELENAQSEQDTSTIASRQLRRNKGRRNRRNKRKKNKRNGGKNGKRKGNNKHNQDGYGYGDGYEDGYGEEFDYYQDDDGYEDDYYGGGGYGDDLDHAYNFSDGYDSADDYGYSHEEEYDGYEWQGSWYGTKTPKHKHKKKYKHSKGEKRHKHQKGPKKNHFDIHQHTKDNCYKPCEWDPVLCICRCCEPICPDMKICTTECISKEFSSFFQMKREFVGSVDSSCR